MGVRKGYKQTEIGVIPEDWEIENLGRIGSFRKGKGIKKDEIVTDGCPCVRYGELYTRHREYIKVFSSFVSMDVAKESQRIYKGDILFAGSGETKEEIGKCAAFLDDREAYASGDVIILSPVNSDSLFLGFLLNHELIARQKSQFAQGDAVVHIYPNNLAEITIPLPPKAEQEAIATVLSDTDALIQALEKLIAKKRLIKQGAMQELLKPKESWVVKKLGELGKISGAGVDKKINPDEVTVRLVNYLDVFNRDFIYSKELSHFVTAPANKAHNCAVEKGDIFFTPSSEMQYDIAISAVAMEDISDAVYSYHLTRLRLFENWSLAFRTYIFKTRYFLDQAETVCEGSGKRYVISLSKFREMTIWFPPDIKEQTRIAGIISDMDAEITALESKLAKYKQIKQGMMQELLTGRIRLV